MSVEPVRQLHNAGCHEEVARVLPTVWTSIGGQLCGTALPRGGILHDV